MKSGLIMIVTTMSFAALAFGREPDLDILRSYEAPTYDIWAPDKPAALAATRAVVRGDAMLGKLLGRANPARNAPTFILVVPDALRARYLAPRSGLTGSFVAGRFANYIETRMGRDVEPGVLHEYAHCYLHTQFSGPVPLWFDEGMARFIETTTFRKVSVTVGEPLASDWDLMPWIPMAELLGLDHESHRYRDPETTVSVLRQSWLMVQRGVAADRQRFGRQMYALLQSQDEGAPLETAIPKIFGMTPEAFDRDMHDYAQRDFRTLQLELEIPPLPQLPAGKDQAALEALDLFAGMMATPGEDAAKLAEIVGTMERLAPFEPRTRGWRMRVAARREDGTAVDYMAHDVTDADDPLLLRHAGLALFEVAIDPQRDGRLDRAFTFLDRAAMSRPDDAEVAWAYATIAAQLKRDLPVARRRIEAMRSLWPANADLAMAATQVYDALGDQGKARLALQDTRRLAKRPEMIQWAKQRLAN